MLFSQVAYLHELLINDKDSILVGYHDEQEDEENIYLQQSCPHVPLAKNKKSEKEPNNTPFLHRIIRNCW